MENFISSAFDGKRGANPYRSGVLIGNYVEDMFGLDLKKKYGNNLRRSADFNALTESQDNYRWPKYALKQLGQPGNDLTMSCNMNYDLNIDFTRNKLEDFKTLSKPNEYSLDNKNVFMPDEIKIMKYQKSLEDEKNNIIQKESIETQSQNALSQLNAKDASTILFTKKSGLSGNLMFGHGQQNTFNKNSLVSVNDLSYSQHIPTKTFLNNDNDFESTLKINRNKDKDFMDWGYRRYREYGFFTKKFDKKKEE